MIYIDMFSIRLSLNGFVKKFSTSAVLRSSVQVEQSDGVRRIILNSPKTRNCLSGDFLQELNNAFRNDWDDTRLRCFLLSATGPVFCSGYNLKHLHHSHGLESQQKLFNEGTKLMETILEAPVPVIAVVNGLAAAAGCQLAAVCDIVIATENSSFSTPGASFGVFCHTPGVAVARTVPRNVAGYMLFTGLPLTAADALQAGLVSKLVSSHRLEEEVDVVVASILSKSRSILELGKRFLQKQICMDTHSAFRAGEKMMMETVQMEDSQEGIESFMEKRKPHWSHQNKHKT